MIWHIFKKDVKLSWRMAAAVACLHWASAVAALIMLTTTSNPAALKARNLAGILIIGGLAATGFIITAVVHHDAIPGVRQDWLVRPVRRRDLILAKVLFVALMVQLPVFLGDAAASLFTGISLPSSLMSALQRSAIQMLVINLPFLALAAITQNLLEIVSAGVVLGLSAAAVVGLTPNTSPLVPLLRTGLYWIEMSAAGAALTLGSLAVLCVQYSRRRTVLARSLTAGATALFLLTQFIPWQPAFALQRSLAEKPGTSGNLVLSFDAAADKFRPPAGGLSTDAAAAILRAQFEDVVRVYLPFRLTGLPPDSFVRADHSTVRIIEPGGHTEELSFNLDFWNSPAQGVSETSGTVYTMLEIPAGLYKKLKAQPVRIEGDFWLTLIQSASTNTLPAINGKQDIAGAGQCRTRINDAETAVTFSCLRSGPAPACFSYVLEHLPDHERNPGRLNCGYYVNLPTPILPISLNAFGGFLPFRDAAGLAKYPVDGSKLRESQVVFQTYRTQDHFMRSLSIPEVRLTEWIPEGTSE
jgi:ABC-type transport system involved in cytochrome c biogenesis permease component